MDIHSATKWLAGLSKPIKIALAAALAVVVLSAGYVGVAKATDQPAFCGSACHEMGPYHEAWAGGAHKGIACVDCHVDPSPVAQLEHKFVALGEVVDHIKGAPNFPLATAPDVPDSRCIRCHENIVVNQVGFSHADHAKRGPCVKCHSDVGHNVTSTALRQAGLLNVAYMHTTEPTQSATPGGGAADIPGHLAVGCSRCHDMATMGCKSCHTPGPNHQNRPADCSICHQPGAKFVFTHPQRTDCEACHTPPSNVTPPHTWTGTCTQCHLSGPGVDWKFTHPNNNSCATCHTPPSTHKWTGTCTDCHKAGPGKSFAVTHPTSSACDTCHARPANHRSGACSTCHQNPGVNWKFAHPGSGATCASCHTPPANHSSRSCSTCHKNTGQSWTFSHPSSNDCASCHNPPAKHNAGSCSTCHKLAGQSWKFSHPSAGASCANCHAAPKSHYGSTCQNCHKKPGKSWAFSHPSTSSGCTSCHTAPASHYGTNCATCHTAGTTWANANFNHPAIPRGQHSYKSFACSKCHPSGPPAYYCSCHGNTTGPTGD